MRTFDNAHVRKKGKLKRKKSENANLAKIQRYVASLDNEQISRMIADSAGSYVTKGADATGRSIYENSINPKQKIQPKLEISQPQDKSELQADKVAEGVTKGDVQLSKSALEQPVSDINTKGEGSGMTTTPQFDQQLGSTKGQGQKLDANVRSEMESHLGSDLSGVSIHTSGNAKSMSENINAKAFTHGQDVYFNEGQYNPSSDAGKSLLAHELTHTVQQSGGKVQTKIQRQPTGTTKVKDGGERQHAEGKFHGDTGEGGYIITPAAFPITKEYYGTHPDEKSKMLADHPGTKLYYNTFYSLAERFGISLDALMQANLGVAPEKIGAGKKIIIPYVAQEEFVPLKPIEIKQLTVDRPLPELKQIPVPGTELGPVVTPEPGYANYKERKHYNSLHVQEAALNILMSDPKIMDAMIFLGKIKTNDPEGGMAKWKEELMLFFKDGPDSRKPLLTITPLEFQGATPEENRQNEAPNQDMLLNSKNEFSVAVSTYLHEMNHYIDIWYNSRAAQKIIHKRRPESEKQPGIEPVEEHDMSKQEQVDAVPEYLTALIDQIIIDMQQPKKQPNEHWAVKNIRKDYKRWQKHPNGKSKEEFIAEKEKELVVAMEDKNVYGRWGLTGDADSLKATGVEHGYAFEKAAYGFEELAEQQGIDKANWAGNFNENFEKRFYMFLGKNK